MPKVVTKILLVALAGLITFHLIMISSKVYSFNSGEFKILNVSEDQYLNYIHSFNSPITRRDVIEQTKVTYVFGLSGQTFLYIYLGYFIITSALIVTSKIKSEISKDGTR